MWRPFDNGATVGQPGSEGGVTVRDEEHALGRGHLRAELRALPLIRHLRSLRVVLPHVVPGVGGGGRVPGHARRAGRDPGTHPASR